MPRRQARCEDVCGALAVLGRPAHGHLLREDRAVDAAARVALTGIPAWETPRAKRASCSATVGIRSSPGRVAGDQREQSPHVVFTQGVRRQPQAP
jgi:hypothetical protein